MADIVVDEKHTSDSSDKQPTIDHGPDSEHEIRKNNQEQKKQLLDERIFFCEPQPTTSPLKAEVRECDWSQFKNVDATEPVSVIDVLIAGSDINLQVLDESIRRNPREPPGESKWTRNPLRYKKWIPTQRKWVQRIRIRSAVVLNVLNEVSGDKWDTSKAHTFMRPFGYLIFHQGAVKSRLGAVGDGLGTYSAEDLEEIRCYANFVDSSLIPLYNQFQEEKDARTKIRFDELWYLFRPGELIYARRQDNRNFETFRGRDSFVGSTQKIWRVADIRPHEGRVRYDGVYSESSFISDGSDSEEDEDSNDLGVIWFSGGNPPRRIAGWFTLYCYYTDFDGEHFFPVWKTIAVPPFMGERSISSLSVCPLRFAKDSERVYQSGVARGRKFLECVEEKYLWYSGWFLMGEPDGGVMLTTKGEPMNETAVYTGEVYVDVKEALDNRLQWRTWSHGCKPYDVSSRTFVESFPVVTWTGPERKRVGSFPYEILVLNDDVHRFQFNRYLKTDRYISQQGGIDASLFPLQDDDLALLPGRLYVYLLRNHFFIPVDVNDLQSLSHQSNAFDEVIFKEKSPTKDHLNALLDAYFERKKLIEDTSTLAADDFVRGKASGLVILLQGAPGTGKTATVEAIAQSRGRPLIVVNPDDADDDIQLNVIFRVAAKWNCIVLLDEVDVLLGRRNYHDVRGNIWVSKLLRYLETFTGVLFLTTMRAGAFDEGVKSRVHLSICYHPLDEQQTVDIFKIHLNQLRRFEALQHEKCPTYQPIRILEPGILEFAREQYNSNSVKLGRWNGRQIRNAVRVAAAIAHYGYRDDPTLQPQLRADHFKQVEKLTKEYDEIRYKTLGSTDDSYALSAKERFDMDTERATRKNKAPKPNRLSPLPSPGASYERGGYNRAENEESYQNSTPQMMTDRMSSYEDDDNATEAKPKAASKQFRGDKKDGRDPLADDGGGSAHHRVGSFGPAPRISFVPGSSAGSNRKLKEVFWDQED